MKRLLALAVLLALLSGCGQSQQVTEPTAASSVPTAPVSTEAETEPLPDLWDCQAYANVLGEIYGITVLIEEDVQQVTPWDYDLETETDPVVLYRELQKLDRCLRCYPEGMIRTASEYVDGLRIALVRGIYGKAEASGLNAAAGLQYQEQDHTYIAFTSGMPTDHTIHHELFHILELYILAHSEAYDRWEDLNPPDFQYDFHYDGNPGREGCTYLQDETRAFIDSYAMSFPEEDRARVMEYAMAPVGGWLFDSPVMQAKLSLLSLGIREAFGLSGEPGAYLWEQYLNMEP